MYAELGAAEMAALSTAETDRANRYVRAHPEQYRWGFFPDRTPISANGTGPGSGAPIIATSATPAAAHTP